MAGAAADWSTAWLFELNRLNGSNGVQSLNEIGLAAVPHCTTPSEFRNDGPAARFRMFWLGRP